MSFPRYPKYKASGVEWLGEVPEHWEVRRLKQLIDPARQITYGIVQAGPHVSNGVPYVRPADMTDEAGLVDFENIQRTSPEIAAGYRRSEVRTGDLICSIGPSFGKVMIAPPDLEGGNLTQGTARIAVGKGDVTRFVFWVLRSPPSNAQWESAVGGATFRALNLGPLAETVLPHPPFAEQRAIAAFLDRETETIDTLVAQAESAIALLTERRSALISAAVTGQIDVRNAVPSANPTEAA
jgi:type I restriction enzyme S subunit